MFGLFTSCISIVSLIAHYGAKHYYLKKVKASIQQVGLEKTESFGDYTKICQLTSGQKNCQKISHDLDLETFVPGRIEWFNVDQQSGTNLIIEEPLAEFRYNNIWLLRFCSNYISPPSKTVEYFPCRQI